MTRAAPLMALLLVAACASPGPERVDEPPASPSVRELPLDEILYLDVKELESWPGERAARVRPFLEECRGEAAAFVATWQAGNVDALYAQVAREMQSELTPEKFGHMVEDNRRLVGLLAGAAAGQQSLVLPKTDPEALGRLYTEVVYSTYPTPNARVLFVIGLAKDGPRCRVVAFSSVAFTARTPSMQSS